jgi:hypothetical protein
MLIWSVNDLLLRRSSVEPVWPADSQVSRYMRLSESDRRYWGLTAQSGMVVARRRRQGSSRRPSVFQAGHIPSWRGSCGSYALSPGAGVWRWLLLLLAPLLSAPIRRAAGHNKTICVVCRPSFPPACAASAPATFRPGCGPGAPPLPSIGLTAAALFAGGEVSRADSRVRSPGTFTCARCPAARSALDAGPEAYDNPAAVWCGAFAPRSRRRGLCCPAGTVALETGGAGHVHSADDPPDRSPAADRGALIRGPDPCPC